jgi:hypothetical protein
MRQLKQFINCDIVYPMWCKIFHGNEELGRSLDRLVHTNPQVYWDVEKDLKLD